METSRSPEAATAIAVKRQPSTRKSLAATFPPFRGTPRPDARKDDPLPIRMSRAARRVAHEGAMDPEGVTVPNQMRTKANHRIPPAMLKEIMGTVWAFRLLWWTPSDTLYLTYDQIAELVASGTHRPADTGFLIPARFASRLNAEELAAFRRGQGVYQRSS